MRPNCNRNCNREARAALFTIEHYMNNVWDQTEIRAVSGFTVDRFASVRQAIDAASDGPSR